MVYDVCGHRYSNAQIDWTKYVVLIIWQCTHAPNNLRSIIIKCFSLSSLHGRFCSSFLFYSVKSCWILKKYICIPKGQCPIKNEEMWTKWILVLLLRFSDTLRSQDSGKDPWLKGQGDPGLNVRLSCFPFWKFWFLGQLWALLAQIWGHGTPDLFFWPWTFPLSSCKIGRLIIGVDLPIPICNYLKGRGGEGVQVKVSDFPCKNIFGLWGSNIFSPNQKFFDSSLDMTRQSWHLLALFHGFIWKMHPKIDFKKFCSTFPGLRGDLLRTELELQNFVFGSF